MVVVLLEGLMAQVVTSTNGHLQTSGATDQAVLLLLLLRGWRWWRVVAHLLLVVHKVATRSVRTVAGTVEGAA